MRKPAILNKMTRKHSTIAMFAGAIAIGAALVVGRNKRRAARA